MSTSAQSKALGAPFQHAEYTNSADLKAALQAHAKINGFSISVDSSVANRIVYICSKGNKYSSHGKSSDIHESKRRKNTSTMKCKCLYRVIATCETSSLLWTSRTVNEEHNHDAVDVLSALPQYRLAAITAEEREDVAKMNQLGYSPTAILAVLCLANPESLSVARDIYNLLYSLRVEELDRLTSIEWLLWVCFLIQSFACFLLTNYIETGRLRLPTMQIY